MAAVRLPTLIQDIRLNPAGVAKGAKTIKSTMGPVQNAVNGATASTMRMGQSLNTLGFRAQTTGRMMMKFLVVPMTALTAISLKSFSSFEASFAKIEALVGVAGGAVSRFKDNVKGISEATGRAPQELADAMFFITSAGLRAGTAVDVLNASAKAAAVGLGQTKVVADAATSAVNAYGEENLSGSLAVDVLTAAVREGKVEADRLAPAIGKAIPVASAMGVEFHEVAAAIASMTRTGTDARTSAIQLRQIMQSLLDPSRQATKAMKEMGIAEGELRDMAKTDGLLAVLKRLRDLSEENADAFADVFPNIRALAGALDITGANLEENEQIFRALANSAGDTNKAFAITEKTVAHKMNKAMAELKVAFLELGEALLPIADVVIKVIKVFAGLIKWMADRGPIVALIAGIATLGTVMAALLISLGHVATSIAFKQQAMLHLTQTTAANTLATGTNTVAQNQAAVSTALAGKAAATASFGIKAMTFALKGMMAVAVIGVIIGLVSLFSKLGKNAKSTAKEMNELAGSIRDVRNFGDRVLSDVGGLGVAFTGFENMDEAEKIILSFKDAFGDDILEAKDISGEAAAASFVDSMVRAFAGAGDNEEVRAQILAIVAEYHNFVGTAFEDIFEGGFEGDAFANFLGNPDDMEKTIVSGLESTMTAAIMWSDAFIQAAQDKIASNLNPNMEDGNWANAMALSRGEFEEYGESMTDIATRMGAMLKSGEIEDFGVMYKQFVDDLDSRDLDPQVRSALIHAFLSQIPELQDFMPDDIAGFIGFETIIQSIGEGEWSEEIGKAFGDGMFGDKNSFMGGITNTFGELFRDTLIELQKFANSEGAFDPNQRSLLEEMIIGDSNALQLLIEGVELETIAMLHAFEGAGEAAEEASESAIEGFETVDELLVRMDTHFAKVDAAAKRMNKTFDNFVGRGMDEHAAEIGFIEAMTDLQVAVDESGGSLSLFTEEGAKANEAIMEAIESALEWSEAMMHLGASPQEAERSFVNGLKNIENAFLGAGGEVEDFQRLVQGEFGITPQSLGVIFSKENAGEVVSNEFSDAVTAAIDSGNTQAFNGAKTVGGSLIDGIIVGIQERKKAMHAAIAGLVNFTEDTFQDEAIIESPSQRFAVSVGQPITAGIAKGILDGKQNMKNVIREVVNDAISTAEDTLKAASTAITSVFDLGEAQRKLDRLMITAGDKGVDTRWERLNRKKLQRAVDEAKRNLMLGAGNQEDLEIALMEAEFALEDFDTQADVGREVVDAELELAEAGLKVATATAEMKMEGDEAVQTFKALADAVGLSGDRVQELLDLSEGDEAMMGAIFSPDTVQAVKDVAAGLGWISTATGGGSNPWWQFPPDIPMGIWNQTPQISGPVGMWTEEGQGAQGTGGAQPLYDFNHSNIYITMETDSSTGAQTIVNNISNNIDHGDPTSGGRYGHQAG